MREAYGPNRLSATRRDLWLWHAFLVLTLKAGGRIVIGDDIEITLNEVKTEKTIIGVDAPKSLPVYRVNGRPKAWRRGRSELTPARR